MVFPEPPHHTFTNLRKANWSSYTWETEEGFSNLELPSSCSTGEKEFRRVITNAAKKHIPRGHIPNMIPNLTNTSKRLINERDSLRRLDPTDPHISALDTQITQEIRNSNRQTWIHTVESCSHKLNTSQYFSLLRSLSGKRISTPPNQPITFNSKTLTRNREISIAFNKQFTSTVPHSSDPTTRLVKRRLNKLRPLDTNLNRFTPDLVSQAIRKSGNSRAAGPDGFTNLHLKHLGPLGLQYLTNLFNLSFNHADIPSIWKLATVFPLLKAGKPVGLGSNYRPISLPCPAAEAQKTKVELFISYKSCIAASYNKHF